MSDFLTRLIQRQTGSLPTVQPRPRSMFAPATDQPGFSIVDESAMAEPAPAEVLRRMPEAPSRVAPTTPSTSAIDAPLPAGTPVGRIQAAPVIQPPPVAEPSPTAIRAEGRAARSEVTSIEQQPPLRTRSLPVAPAGPEPNRRSAENRPERSGRTEVVERPLMTPPLLLVRSPHAQPSLALSAPPSLRPAEQSGQGPKQGQLNEEPPVQVTIGRIEVTAQSTPAFPKRKTGSRPPSMSLEDYLARRHGGRA
ncbi:MAG: hypothetical protein NBKEAIPA_01096 [Nitrospirae bacterium]|nr:hypothetical protein [Nitrospirota bacterium]MCE7966840.1 hypothetical protein [Nitrospira sp. NTP2]MCK6492578.1 hypothetical protein [Nitrospira sp.]MEB2337752.1 hypothetical protein [Nitrospirales bacterium]RIK59648.1 MAG: hypothetical protein DCC63_06635 [Nitrospira sp.]